MGLFDGTNVPLYLTPQPTRRRLALLIAAPRPGETAMHNDLVAMYDALRRRGFLPGEIWALEGVLSRDLVLAFLQAAHSHLTDWPDGDLFLHYSGHGVHPLLGAADDSQPRPGLWVDSRSPTPDRCLFWDELLATLNVPEGVRFTLLPDC